MTSSKMMTRQELLELAALDAFGLLDVYEAEIYTRSFHDAPAGVQDEIIELQAELISDQSLLPDDEPALELRQRVLEAVARAIEAESVHLHPLATIGRKPSGFGDVIGQIPLGRSGQFWRAAAFVLAGVVVVMAFFWSEATRHGNTISRLALTRDTSAELKKLIDPTFEDFLGNPNCQWVHLKADAFGQPGQVAVLVNHETREALMLALGLPDINGPYMLSVKDAEGTGTSWLGEFSSNGSVASLPLHGIDPVRLTSAILLLTGSDSKVLFSGSA